MINTRCFLLVGNTHIIPHFSYKIKGNKEIWLFFLRFVAAISKDPKQIVHFFFTMQLSQKSLQYLKIMLYYSWLKCLKSKQGAVIIAIYFIFAYFYLGILNNIKIMEIVKIHKNKENCRRIFPSIWNNGILNSIFKYIFLGILKTSTQN